MSLIVVRGLRAPQFVLKDDGALRPRITMDNGMFGQNLYTPENTQRHSIVENPYCWRGF